MEQKQSDTSLGKKIRFLRNESKMTQEQLAKELNVTRQALSNWERDIYEPDMNTLTKICCIFGVKMDDLVMEAMKMEEKKEPVKVQENPGRKAFNKYDMAIGLFYGAAFFLGVGIFFTVGFLLMTPMGWAASLFAGGCAFLVLGLLAHAIITLMRKDK